MKTSFSNKIEDMVDKISKRVEAVGYSKQKYNADAFHNLMNQLVSEGKFGLRSRDDDHSTYVLNVYGRTFGELSQAKILFGKEATPAMYQNMKSRFECRLMEDGIIEVKSFEFIFLALKKENEAFKKLLSLRLDVLLQMIDEEEEDDIVVEEPPSNGREGKTKT